MNGSSDDPDDFSCLGNDVSRNSVTPDVWMIYEDFRYGSPVVAVILIVFFCVAFSSNLFIIVSMLWQRMVRQPAHILLLNLAVSDLLVAVLVMPVTITSGIAREFVFGSSDYTRCKVCQTGVIFVILSQLSFHTIALLSLDRLLFIRFPLRYKKLVTARRAIAAVLSLWILCVFLTLPPLFGFGEVKLSTSVGNCFVSFFGETPVTKNIFYLLVLVIEALLPIGVLAVTNVWLVGIIIRHIRQVFHMRKSLTANSKLSQTQSLRGTLHRRRSRQQVQLVKVFGVILIANLITWLPAIILAGCALFVDVDHVPAEVIATVYLSYISHTVIHPLLESCFIARLRRLVVRCVCCRREGEEGGVCCRSEEGRRERSRSSRRGSSQSNRKNSIGIVGENTAVRKATSEERGGGGGRGEGGERSGSCCYSCMILNTCSTVLLSDMSTSTGGGGGGGRQGAQSPTSPTSTELSIVSPFAREPSVAIDDIHD